MFGMNEAVHHEDEMDSVLDRLEKLERKLASVIVMLNRIGQCVEGLHWKKDGEA